MYYKINRNYENFEKAVFSSNNYYEFPTVRAIHNKYSFDGLDVVPFNIFRGLSKDKRSSCVPHFFIDDYQFLSVWRFPEKYLNMFSSVPFMLGFDFSLYGSMPKALQIYNKYRCHWLDSFYSSCGIDVIPFVHLYDYGDPDLYEGIGCGSVICITSQGLCGSDSDKELFESSLNYVLHRIKPTQVICYGSLPDCFKSDPRFFELDVFSKKFRK